MNFINKFTLGTANFGNNYGLKGKKINIKNIDLIFNFLNSKKLFNLDTAIGYDNEKVLSKFINKEWRVTSKIPLINGQSNNLENLSDVIKLHIHNLKIEKLDNLLIHNSADLKKYGQNLWSILNDLKTNKLVKNIGISIYDVNKNYNLIKTFKPDVIQMPINIFDRRFLNKSFLSFVNRNNIKIQARSIFLQGLLLDEEIQKNLFYKYKNYFEKYFNWLEQKKINPIEGCIYFVKKI